MSRKIATLTLVAIVTTLSLSAAAQAGCHSKKNYGGHYNHHRNYHHVVRTVHQPVVVRHVVQAPPIVAPVVHAPAPAPAPEPQLPSVPAGATLTLPANFLGSQPGNVFLVFHNIKLPAQVLKWDNNGVTVTLPPMAIKDPLKLRLDVVLPDGKLGHQQQILVTAPAAIIVHPTAPNSPLPTIN